MPWLADFRDPWTTIDYYHDFMLTKFADRKHKRLEQNVLNGADEIITVSEECKNELESLCNRKVKVITNGFDELDVEENNLKSDKKFSFVHMGVLFKNRNSPLLWKVLSELVNENTDFKNDIEIKLVGKIDYDVRQSLEKYDMLEHIIFVDYIIHDEVLNFLQKSQILLLLVNNSRSAKGMLTGKFFEYLLARKPVLAIGPTDGDLAKIINETNCGKIIDFDDEAIMKSHILQLYKDFKKGSLVCNSENIMKYSRRELTRSLAGLLDEIGV